MEVFTKKKQSINGDYFEIGTKPKVKVILTLVVCSLPIILFLYFLWGGSVEIKQDLFKTRNLTRFLFGVGSVMINQDLLLLDQIWRISDLSNWLIDQIRQCDDFFMVVKVAKLFFCSFKVDTQLSRLRYICRQKCFF